MTCKIGRSNVSQCIDKLAAERSIGKTAIVWKLDDGLRD